MVYYKIETVDQRSRSTDEIFLIGGAKLLLLKKMNP
jgi:hypothetical protein